MNENKELREKLFYSPKNGCDRIGDEEKNKIDVFAEEYKSFMRENKTEREICSFISDAALGLGYVPFDKSSCKPGDKILYVNRSKSVIMAIIGKKPVECGVKIAASHIDSPRLDLKPNPVYESNEIAYFKTHYYGGIKKYQWPALPLSLHGVIVKGDGEVITVKIGEKEGEPKFVITDLLPHLADEQMKRTLSQGIKGEELNVVIGSLPFKDDEGSERVKLNILNILFEKYGITEEDFISAELEVVPALGVDDIGFDRSLIGAYGHDDRVCAYPAFRAICDTDEPEYTCITVLTDKEETGSDGNTGLHSSYLTDFIKDLAVIQGGNPRTALANSKCLSADVNAAYDPTFSSPFEERNSSYVNRGIVLTKYTGSRGKYSTNDASAEFTGEIRRLFNRENVIWQAGELGKVDAGGGGTVAKYVSAYNVDVIDVGVPVLSMHAPYEVISKLDLFMAYKGFSAFFKN